MRGVQCLTARSYEFRSCPSALALPPSTLHRIIEDCQCVFGKGGGSEKTWWLACDGRPRCALEQLALAVFKVSGRSANGCTHCDACRRASVVPVRSFCAMSVNAAMLLTHRGVNRTAGARARDVRQGA